MKTLKIFVLLGALALVVSFISPVHADTIGCHKYKWQESHSSGHWEKVVKDLKIWTTSHKKHHPYYYTMKKKLVNAEYNLKQSKHSRHGQKKHRKHHRNCKVDVSPS